MSTDMKTIKAGSRRSEDTYQRLLGAVISVVFAQGYAGATMSRIAQEAGVTRGAIQHYFGDRRVELMAAVCADILQQRQDAYRGIMAELGKADFARARAQVKDGYRDPATWFLIEVWIASKSDATLRARVEDDLRNNHYVVDVELAKLFESFGTTQMEFRTFKYLMRAVTRGLAVEFARRPDQALFDSVVDLLFDAVEALVRHGRR